MGKGAIFIIAVIVGIFLLALYQQGGWDNFKAKPSDSIIQSTKTVGKGIKDTYDKGKDLIGGDNQVTNATKTHLVAVGQIPCAINEDCNVLSDCSGNLCVCNKNEGVCYK